MKNLPAPRRDLDAGFCPSIRKAADGCNVDMPNLSQRNCTDFHEVQSDDICNLQYDSSGRATPLMEMTHRTAEIGYSGTE